MSKGKPVRVHLPQSASKNERAQKLLKTTSKQDDPENTWKTIILQGSNELSILDHAKYSGSVALVVVDIRGEECIFEDIELTLKHPINMSSGKLVINRAVIHSESSNLLSLKGGEVIIKNSTLKLSTSEGSSSILSHKGGCFSLKDSKVRIESREVPHLILTEEQGNGQILIRNCNLELKWSQDSPSYIYKVVGDRNMLVDGVIHTLESESHHLSVIFSDIDQGRVEFRNSVFSFSQPLTSIIHPLSRIDKTVPTFTNVSLRRSMPKPESIRGVLFNDESMAITGNVRTKWRTVKESCCIDSDDSLIVGENEEPITITLLHPSQIAGVTLTISAQDAPITITSREGDPEFICTLKKGWAVNLGCTNTRWIIKSVA